MESKIRVNTKLLLFSSSNTEVIFGRRRCSFITFWLVVSISLEIFASSFSIELFAFCIRLTSSATLIKSLKKIKS